MCINNPSVEVIAGMDGSFPIEGAKQELHQLCVKKKWPEPIYMIEHESGPPHEMKFVSTVQIATIDSVLCMTGDEKSRRRQAENSAASLMILALHDSDYKFRHVLEPVVTLEE
ncbi:hypothetical protein M0R45_015330 [Rubus argutus]|uniref:DRBM domain-containing protein n=1 Tax=Rubus argutus TaxID=59490 RepID=A0AAW1XPW2_RUBAR